MSFASHESIDMPPCLCQVPSCHQIIRRGVLSALITPNPYLGERATELADRRSPLTGRLIAIKDNIDTAEPTEMTPS